MTKTVSCDVLVQRAGEGVRPVRKLQEKITSELQAEITVSCAVGADVTGRRIKAKQA